MGHLKTRELQNAFNAKFEVNLRTGNVGRPKLKEWMNEQTKTNEFMDERICHSSVGFQLCLWERKTGKQRSDFQRNSAMNGNSHIAKSPTIFTFKKHGVRQGQLTFRAIRIQWSGCLLSKQQSCQSYSGYFQEPHWRSMGLPEISWLTWQLWKSSLKVL